MSSVNVDWYVENFDKFKNGRFDFEVDNSLNFCFSPYDIAVLLLNTMQEDRSNELLDSIENIQAFTFYHSHYEITDELARLIQMCGRHWIECPRKEGKNWRGMVKQILDSDALWNYRGEK